MGAWPPVVPREREAGVRGGQRTSWVGQLFRAQRGFQEFLCN